MDEPVELEIERAALARARTAVQAKLERLATIQGGGADALADEYIDAVVAGAIDRLRHELVVFGRVDDPQPWRIGLYGIDDGADQLVVDWRAPFAAAFYQAGFAEPLGLTRRVSYVGCIDDLFVEDFTTREVSGSSPLLAELARSRGAEMRTAVATLQADQDRLVRLDPEARLVVRGGPGTGKTVVGLHRAAWLVYNDTRVSAERILVLGPSDRFLRFIAAVLPTLGETKVHQTTFERLLGPTDEDDPAVGHPQVLAALDRWEQTLVRPDEIPLGTLRRIPVEVVADTTERMLARDLPWRDRRRLFCQALASRYQVTVAEVGRAARHVWPAVTTRQVCARLRDERRLVELGVDPPIARRWAAGPRDGAFDDEVRARVEGVPARYAHVIVDEAQDLSPLQLRAVQRRARGVTLVGDDAQRSSRLGLGLRRAAAELHTEPAVLDTAYRMSAEIAEWLNGHAAAHGIDAVPLVGIRPTGVPVVEVADVQAAVGSLRTRWPDPVVLRAGEVWDHKGVEYDAVVVDRTGMAPAEVYLAASRAAHALAVAGDAPAVSPS